MAKWSRVKGMTFRFAHNKELLFLLVGIVYGAALAFVGFMLAGVGHGSYLLLFVAAAPFSFVGFWPMFIFPLLMWGIVGWLLGSSSRFEQRLAVGITLFHYVSVALGLYVLMSPVGEFVLKMFQYDYWSAVIGTSIYLLGQILIWVGWLTRPRLR